MCAIETISLVNRYSHFMYSSPLEAADNVYGSFTSRILFSFFTKTPHNFLDYFRSFLVGLLLTGKSGAFHPNSCCLLPGKRTLKSGLKWFVHFLFTCHAIMFLLYLVHILQLLYNLVWTSICYREACLYFSSWRLTFLVLSHNCELKGSFTDDMDKESLGGQHLLYPVITTLLHGCRSQRNMQSELTWNPEVAINGSWLQLILSQSLGHSLGHKEALHSDWTVAGQLSTAFS